MKANKKMMIIVDENGNGIVTKAFAKQAKIFGTEEYKLWKEFKAEYPNATMVHKTIKKNPDKKPEVRLSYPKMREFIKVVETDVEQRAAKLAELEKQIKLSKVTANPYRTVLDWFKSYDKYIEYLKSTEAKSEDDNQNSGEATELHEESVEFAKAGNF